MKQKTLIDEPVQEDPVPEVKKLSCNFHRWVCREDDFILRIVKKSGAKVLRCRYCEKTKEENKRVAKLDWQKHKENLTDYYILNSFVRGNKMAMPMNEYPQELVEAKRASLKLKRQVEKENEPLKKCTIHGKLFRDDVIKGGYRKTGDIAWRCKKCMKDLHAKNYELNKLKILKRLEHNRKVDPVKNRAIKKKSRIKHLETERAKSRERFKLWAERNPEKNKEKEARARQKRVDDLLPSYVKEKLIRGTILKPSDISEELMQTAKAIMLLKRNIKIKKQHDKILLITGEQDNGKD